MYGAIGGCFCWEEWANSGCWSDELRLAATKEALSMIDTTLVPDAGLYLALLCLELLPDAFYPLSVG